MPESPPLLLLGGPSAMDLSSRLQASGYETLVLPGGDNSWEPGEATPAAVILSPSWHERIPSLRRRWGRLPILLGCRHDSVEGRCQALSSGADDLWLTSAGPSDLLTRLRLHLNLQRGSRKGAQSLLVVADLEVDPREQSVQRGGQPIPLTTREFQLLMLLLQESPNVVGREQILRAIWPEERTASSNVIEVYVRYLRKKLEVGNRPRLIHTVRGLGYCLKE